jgi:hypothetical protein
MIPGYIQTPWRWNSEGFGPVFQTLVYAICEHRGLAKRELLALEAQDEIGAIIASASRLHTFVNRVLAYGIGFAASACGAGSVAPG